MFKFVFRNIFHHLWQIHKKSGKAILLLRNFYKTFNVIKVDHFYLIWKYTRIFSQFVLVCRINSYITNSVFIHSNLFDRVAIYFLRKISIIRTLITLNCTYNVITIGIMLNLFGANTSLGFRDYYT